MTFVLMPNETLERIEGYGSAWGIIRTVVDPHEDLIVATHSSKAEQVMYPDEPAWLRTHHLFRSDHEGDGVWYRVDPVLLDLHDFVFQRQGALATEQLREHTQGGWRHLPPEAWALLITWARVGSERQVRAWRASGEWAQPLPIHIVDSKDPLEFLRPGWPVDDLRDQLVTIVGVGSIGSAAASALARDGIRHFALVDHDRLLEHNVIRHELTLADLGRLKVEALAAQLRSRYGDLDIERLPLDAVESADVMRPLFARSSIVLCATDGVGARRVVNHLARRAGVPAVLACVLGDGAIGEVIRVQPGVGCLTCLRTNLRDNGSMDLEPTIDREYGMGTTHLPMTAVPGDLRVVAELAAKVTVGTLMERKGYADQRMPADYAVIGLRPNSVYLKPFDVARAGEVRWHATGPPRPDCLTCAGSS